VKSIKDIFRSYAVLDSQGRHVNGTDKQSNHNYSDAYEWLLEKPDQSAGYHNVDDSFCSSVTANKWVSIRDEVKLMMEVGVADGSCLLAWREIFPNATIVGMDIHRSEKAHGYRIEFHMGDQCSPWDCKRATAGRLFDLIVDDATHQLENTLRTLYWLWPSVKPGGLYVVEEWPNVDPVRIRSLWPQAEVVDTVGPFGGSEPLIVFRKPR
jgi:hypothetical protein